MSLIQIRRYEAGAAQPTMELIKKLAIALTVSSDALVFGKDERGPDGALRLQFEATFNTHFLHPGFEVRRGFSARV